jgi:hypothetical protein
MCHFQGHKTKDEFIKGSLLIRKYMHLIETKCKMPVTLRNAKGAQEEGE